MSYSFDARHGLIILLAELFGTSGSIIVRLALDTGATRTTHTLPPSASVDGLLGLDFFRGQILNLDFRTGVVMLI